MVRKLPATVRILKIIQLTVILMTSHKLKSSLHIVVQERSGWKGEESMRGWKDGGGASMQFYLLATMLPRLRNVLSRTEPGVLSELL